MPKIQILDRDGRWNRKNEDELLWWPRIQYIDPGVVSGVAVVWFDPKALLVDDRETSRVLLAYSETFLQGPEHGTGGQIHQFLRMHHVLDAEPGLAAGCESFVPRQMNMDPEFLSPVRIRAGIEYTLSRKRRRYAEDVGPRGLPLLTQSPSDALNVFTNERLKALGMYRPGPDHVNDAKRHCLLHIRKLKGEGRGLPFFNQIHGEESGWFQ